MKYSLLHIIGIDHDNFKLKKPLKLTTSTFDDNSETRLVQLCLHIAISLV